MHGDKICGKRTRQVMPSAVGQTMSFSLAHVSPEYSRFRFRLVLGLLLVACLTIVSVSWKIYSSFVDRENAARVQTQTYVDAIAAHVSDSIELADYALMGFVNAIKVLPPEKRNFATIRQLLESHEHGRDAFWMMFIDARGVGVATSKNAAVLGQSFIGDDFFKAHAQPKADLGLFIGAPGVAEIAKTRTLILSRRVVSAQGAFLGVIIAPMDVGRFASMFERARFERKDISISLLHQGGEIVASVPLFEQTAGARLLNSNFFQQLHGVSAKTFQANNPVDGQPMIYSVRVLESRPLDVVVGITVQALNQALRGDLLIGGAAILLIVTIMLLSAHVALGSYRRLEVNKQALQQSEFRWKFALEGAGEGVWDWNIVPNEVQFSRRWKQMLGYAENEIEDTSDAWEKRIYPEDKSRVIAEIQACLAGKTPVHLCEYRILCKDGSWKWILSRGMVISRDGAGRALRMIGTHADISGRKQAEQAQVHRIVEAAPDPMLLVGIDGRIIFANCVSLSTFGYTLNELRERNIDDLLSFNSENRRVQWSALFRNDTQHPLDFKNPLTAVHGDGTEFPVEISLSPFQMDGHPVIIANIRDISKSQRAAELLEQSFAQLRLLSDHQQNIKEDERKRIAQDIHDDLGQNLLVLKMDATSLYARTERAHSKLHQRVGLVLANIDAAIKSVKSIMNDLRPATLELGLGPAVEWQLKQFERNNGIACKLTIIAAEAEFGLDEGRTLAVFRILQESLTNVARHAQATEVDIALGQDEHGFSMTVKDNGKGLQPGDKKKANSFGLMGMKERIEALGGELNVTSSPDNGTALSIFIPIDKTGSALDTGGDRPVALAPKQSGRGLATALSVS